MSIPVGIENSDFVFVECINTDILRSRRSPHGVLPGSVDPDEGTAFLTAVLGRFIVFRLDDIEIPALQAVNLSAFRANAVPEFLFVDRQVTVTAAELLPLSAHKDQFLVPARSHNQEDTGLRYEKQTGTVTSIHRLICISCLKSKYSLYKGVAGDTGSDFIEKVLLEDSEGLREITPPIQGDPALLQHRCPGQRVRDKS